MSTHLPPYWRSPAENGFNAYFHDLSEGVVVVEHGHVKEMNRIAGEFLATDPEQAKGQPLIRILRDHRLEHVFLSKESTELETRGRILRASANGSCLFLTDVSEARRAQDAARELLAVLSHELRTPATTIRSTLEALHYPLEDAQRDKFISRAEAETERLVRLLNDLTVDVRPPKLRSLALRDVVARAKAILHETFIEHDITFHCEIPPLTVHADPDKLLQVLINLLENAAVHGPDGCVVSLYALQQGQWVRVSVCDQGEPLPQDTIENLFAPHSRGRGVKAKGTGLGLYIVRSIAERWGGEAWGKPLAKGNEFGFSVPKR